MTHQATSMVMCSRIRGLDPPTAEPLLLQLLARSGLPPDNPATDRLRNGIISASLS